MNKRHSSLLSVMLAMAGLGSTGPFWRRRGNEAQEQRLAKRAEKDLHAARMNYAGWCGRPESGELKAA